MTRFVCFVLLGMILGAFVGCAALDPYFGGSEPFVPGPGAETGGLAGGLLGAVLSTLLGPAAGAAGAGILGKLYWGAREKSASERAKKLGQALLPAIDEILELVGSKRKVTREAVTEILIKWQEENEARELVNEERAQV